LTPLSFREATSRDVAAMAASRLGDLASGPADERMAAYLDGRHHPHLALRPRTAYLALAGDHVVGYIGGHATRRHDCAGEVQYLYVAPTHRRLGVASELLRLLAGWFCDRDMRRVCVNVNTDSEGAEPFYRRHGAQALNKHWYVWEDIGGVLNPV
jgi:GNAT superfamily N-acetyltransferase